MLALENVRAGTGDPPCWHRRTSQGPGSNPPCYTAFLPRPSGMPEDRARRWPRLLEPTLPNGILCLLEPSQPTYVSFHLWTHPLYRPQANAAWHPAVVCVVACPSEPFLFTHHACACQNCATVACTCSCASPVRNKCCCRLARLIWPAPAFPGSDVMHHNIHVVFTGGTLLGTRFEPDWHIFTVLPVAHRTLSPA